MTIQEQYRQAAEDDIKILIVGAGIAGITAARMLRKDGRHPVLIERNADHSHPGYMLALMPMVDSVFVDLRIRDEYHKRSVALNRYGFHGHKGRLIRVDSMADILSRYGDYRGISRGELLDVLTMNGCDVAFNSVITAMVGTANGTQVTFKTGAGINKLEFDLVIIADGIHSNTRNMVLGNRPVDTVDTKWGGWVVWAPEDAHMDLGEELWGAGFFYGVYPVKGSLGVFLGGHQKHTRAGPEKFVEEVRKKLNSINPRMESCLKAIAEARDPFFWLLKDCRCPQWAFESSILLGDAAAGFLPTAGIGAGMAMESAWVLTRMLRYATKGNLTTLLRAFEEAQRPRVEAAQSTSRGLARIMFRQSKILASLRDWSMKIVSVEMALRPIQKLVANKPDPDSIATKVLERES